MTWYRLVGTSHIAPTAKQIIATATQEFKPDVIAVELDPQRLAALAQGVKPDYHPRLIGQLGVRGYLFALIGSLAQRHLGKIVNVTPGSDMLAAVTVAQQEKLRLLLIDRDIRITLQRLNKALGWKEVKQTLKDLWRGLVKGERFQLSLSEVPTEQQVVPLIRLLKTRYPRPHKVLVHERNVHMVKALQKYHADFPHQTILVVIGMGHLPGMRKLLEAQQE